MTLSVRGLMTALATPFKGGALDEVAYAALVEEQVRQGTSVLIPMGTTGEAVTMTPLERRRAVEVCVTANRGRVEGVRRRGQQQHG